jgi:trehalose 6-phosphate synthase
MNLVAHEYVAAQDSADPGVLILSRFAGVAHHFEEALIVNPHDPDEIAEAMHDALMMSLEERQHRHARMFKTLQGLSARAYCDGFLAALDGTKTAKVAA